MKETILQKASDLFLSYGFKSVTMDDIANELAISKKTLYKYYSNKKTLVKESTLLVQQRIDKALWSVKDENYNAIEEEFMVKAIFKKMFRKAKTSPMHQLKKYYPETYTLLMDKEVCTFEDFMLDNLEKGVNNGYYRKEIEKELIVKLYFILIFGHYENDSFSDNMEEVLKLEYKLLEYHTRAIATPKGVEELEKQINLLNTKTK